MQLSWKRVRIGSGKMHRSTVPPERHSKKCAGFADWLATYREYLKEVIEHEDPADGRTRK